MDKSDHNYIRQTIGLIGGTGWIGSLLVKNLCDKQLIDPNNLLIANRSGKAMPEKKYQHISVITDNQQLVDNVDVVIIAVKPNQLVDLKIDLANKLLLSVMAGVSTVHLKNQLNTNQIIRFMPNAAAEIGCSYTPWFTNTQLDNHQLDLLNIILNSIGISQQVTSEDHFNYFTSLIGSGHGTIAYWQQSLINAAQQHGIDKTIAEQAVKQLFFGMSQFMLKQQRDPQQDVDTMIDYAGTTAAILSKFNQHNLFKSVDEAIQSGYQKANSDMTELS